MTAWISHTANPQVDTPAPEVLLLLSDVEKILLGSSDLQSLTAEFRDKDSKQMASSIVPASRIFTRILAQLSKPLRIESETKVHHHGYRFCNCNISLRAHKIHYKVLK